MKIIETYKECGNFKETVEKTGLSSLIVHITLAKAGILKLQDKIKYGTKATILGGKAEELFQKLVPKADNANVLVKKNNPIFDFAYKELTIDVKFSSFHPDKRKKTGYWHVKVNGSPDMFVLFLENEQGQELDNPYILLIPKAFLGEMKHLHVRKNNEWFKNFRVEPQQLNEFLDEYGGLKN